MPIIRTVHDKNNPYFMLNRSAAEDKRLSYKAVGIHTYLMSKPDDWTIRETDLAARHTEGTAAVRSGLRELRMAGYTQATRIRDKKTGRVIGSEIHIYETPLHAHSAGNPHCGKSTLWKTHTVENPQDGEPTGWGIEGIVSNDNVVSNETLVSNETDRLNSRSVGPPSHPDIVSSLTAMGAEMNDRNAAMVDKWVDTYYERDIWMAIDSAMEKNATGDSIRLPVKWINRVLANWLDEGKINRSESLRSKYRPDDLANIIRG